MSDHRYVPDPDLPADHRGDKPCVCGAARSNARHVDQAPGRAPPDDGWLEVDRRRTGEKD